MKKILALFVAFVFLAALASCSDETAIPSGSSSPSESPSVSPTVSPSDDPSSTPSATPSDEPADGSIEFETVKIEHEVEPEGAEPFTFTAEVPSFGIEEVDSYFESKADKFYNGMLEELDGGIGSTDTPYACTLTYEVTYDRGGIVSVVFTKYLNLGGAHPNVSYDCDTINMETVTRLTLADIIGEDGSSTLAALAAEQLSSLGVQAENGQDSLRDSVLEELGNCSFALASDSLDLYFPEYAFGYPGALTVSVSYEELSAGGALADWVLDAQ